MHIWISALFNLGCSSHLQLCFFYSSSLHFFLFTTTKHPWTIPSASPSPPSLLKVAAVKVIYYAWDQWLQVKGIWVSHLSNKRAKHQVQHRFYRCTKLGEFCIGTQFRHGLLISPQPSLSGFRLSQIQLALEMEWHLFLLRIVVLLLLIAMVHFLDS